MFESGCRPFNADLRASADRAFGVLRPAAETLVGAAARRQAPARPDDESPCLVDGTPASPRCSARRRRRRTPADDRRELLESAMLVYLQGLAFRKSFDGGP